MKVLKRLSQCQSDHQKVHVDCAGSESEHPQSGYNTFFVACGIVYEISKVHRI